MGISDDYRTRARRPLAWGVLATAGLTGLLLSACSSSAAHHDAAAKVKPTTTTTTAPPPACPLTGEPAPGGSVPQRPAMAVKIDNYPAGRPQSGLDKADIIFEEPVEGGITRFAAVFQCQNAALIGPVRSARNIDIGILGQLGNPLLAHVGGIDPVIANIDASPIVNVDIGDSQLAHDPPAGPRPAGLRLHLDRHRLRHAPDHDHPTPAALHLLDRHAARRDGGLEREHRLLGHVQRDLEVEQGDQHLPALLQRDDAGHAGRQRAERRRQRRRAVRADQLRALARERRGWAWRSRPTCTPTPAARPSSTATATPSRAPGTARRSGRPPSSSTTSACRSRMQPGQTWVELVPNTIMATTTP